MAKSRPTRGRSRRNTHNRHAQLLVLFSFCFALITARLVWIQVVKAAEYSQKAFNQRLKDIELPARRGTIYDREGEPLAVSVEARTIYVAPNQITDKEGVAKALASALGGKAKDYRKKLEKDSGFEYIARKVDMERATALEGLQLEGVGFLSDYRRVYPSGTLAGQVLGFVGVDKGLAGLELQYDGVLAGVSGVLLGERDPQGQPIPGGIQKEIDATHGHDVVLTIDKDIQYEAQLQLNKAVRKWGAKGGSVVIMNPRSGEIYAMASTPGFNPNKYAEADASDSRNSAVCDAYEPGSTLKSLTAASVVEEGLYKPNSKFTLPPTLRVGGRTIHESHGRGTVRWTLTDIVTESSNVGTVKLGLKLGVDRLYRGLASFGLTEPTGVDFPGEAIGWLPPPDQWSASSIGNIPFGQGVSVTPLQLSRALSGIAADGLMPTPHFLLDIPNGSEKVPGWPAKRAISKKTATSVTKMLKNVVVKGTGKAAAVPGYSVAGKTGTAQKALPGGRGYAGGRYVGSFIGFLPAEDPQVLLCVTIDEPSNAIYGGAVAAPTFSKLARFTVEHLRIPPTETGSKDGSKQDLKPSDVETVSDEGARD